MTLGAPSATNSAITTLDLRGTTSFAFGSSSANSQAIHLGNTGNATSNMVNVYLSATTNTINALSISLDQQNNGTFPFGGSALYLGQSNTFNLGAAGSGVAIKVGSYRSGSSTSPDQILFQSGLTNALLKVRADDGTSRAGDIIVGVGQSGTNSTQPLASTFDLGFAADVLVSNIQLAYNLQIGTGPTVTGKMQLEGGSLNAETLTLGQVNTPGSSIANGGILNGQFIQSGGTAVIGKVNFGDTIAIGGSNVTYNAIYTLSGGSLLATNLQVNPTNAALFNVTSSRTLALQGGTLGNYNSDGTITDLMITGQSRTGGSLHLSLAAGTTSYITVDAGHIVTVGSNADIIGSGNLSKTGAGTLLFNSANNYTGSTIISAGALQLNTAGALPAGTNLSIGTGASVVAATLGSTTALQVGTLSVNGSLDLTNNALIVHATSLTTITNLLASGCQNGLWDGPTGILSTTASNDPSHLTSLGILFNDNLGKPYYGSGGSIASTFEGVVPADGDVLVKYTYYGDADLNGVVNGDDYAQIDFAYSTHNSSGWQNGDFNYDGVIDGSDYTLVDNAFNRQNFITIDAAAKPLSIAAIAAVPEPTQVFAVALLTLTTRRLRRKSSRPDRAADRILESHKCS